MQAERMRTSYLLLQAISLPSPRTLVIKALKYLSVVVCLIHSIA